MNSFSSILFIIITLLVPISAISSPPMGWLSWNLFEGDINESLVLEIADAMENNGMESAGYEFIIIDDLWQGGRDADSNLIPDPDKFPNGIKFLADKIHEKGLKLGVYTDAAELTCGGKTGSWGHVERDMETFARWGIDYIKIDYCHAPKDLFSAIERYGKFGQAIKKTGRNMVFAICEWGQRSPWLWGPSVSATLWRTTWDIRDIWEHGEYNSSHCGIMEALDRQVGLYRWADSGRYNDPDMLVVGLYGKGESASASGASGCSVLEYQSQMSLWCLLSAPLLACCDIRNLDAETKRILTNHEVIAVNQDQSQQQARRIFKENEKEIWAKPLSDGNYVLGFLNREDSSTVNFSFDLKKLGYSDKVSKTRCLWEHKNINTNTDSIHCSVLPHEVKLIKVFK